MTGHRVRLPMPARFRLVFTALEPVRLADFTGSAWRGLMGHGLRRVACVMRSRDCGGCLLHESCVHARVFESLGDAAGDHRARPHPFVLDIEPTPQPRLAAGDELTLGLTLFGEGREALPYLIQAFIVAGRLGMGRSHGRFELRQVLAESVPGTDEWLLAWDDEDPRLRLPKTHYPFPSNSPACIDIELMTPLRMKANGRFLGPVEFSGEHFLRRLWSRTRDLARCHGGADDDIELPLPSSYPDSVPALRKQMRWRDWQRYSSRQRQVMTMGGLLGSWGLDGDILAEWWPLLCYGQWVHLGKATTMGLGRYRLVAVENRGTMVRQNPQSSTGCER